MKLIIYSDGGSRGNPGNSAIAFKIMTENGELVKGYNECVGIRTNNQAEYEALISALEFASRLTDEEVTCHIDSELVIKQLNGEYKVRNPNLKILHSKIKKLKQKFRRITFKHVPRTDMYIQEVDRLVNQSLDEAGK
jgi:ribonuclease HI